MKIDAISREITTFVRWDGELPPTEVEELIKTATEDKGLRIIGHAVRPDGKKHLLLIDDANDGMDYEYPQGTYFYVEDGLLYTLNPGQFYKDYEVVKAS